MTTMKLPDTGTALVRARMRDPWPRLTDWFDTMLPTDFGWRGGDMHTMRVEEFEQDGAFIIRAELPGMDPDKDIEVSVGDGLLSIEAHREERKEGERRSEFSYGTFIRTLTLPQGTDDSSVSAEYRDGILIVKVQLRDEAATVTTKVPVTRG